MNLTAKKWEDSIDFERRQFARMVVQAHNALCRESAGGFLAGFYHGQRNTAGQALRWLTEAKQRATA